MSIQRYRRKPERVADREVQVAARYEPGKPLGDLLAVARMADGEVAEVTFPSGPVLLARFERFYDEHPSRVEYVAVEPGRFLAYSPGEGFLYEATEANWRQWYDQVNGDGQR